jgi:hypothetical protein
MELKKVSSAYKRSLKQLDINNDFFENCLFDISLESALQNDKVLVAKSTSKTKKESKVIATRYYSEITYFAKEYLSDDGVFADLFNLENVSASWLVGFFIMSYISPKMGFGQFTQQYNTVAVSPFALRKGIDHYCKNSMKLCSKNVSVTYYGDGKTLDKISNTLKLINSLSSKNKLDLIIVSRENTRLSLCNLLVLILAKLKKTGTLILELSKKNISESEDILTFIRKLFTTASLWVCPWSGKTYVIAISIKNIASQIRYKKIVSCIRRKRIDSIDVCVRDADLDVDFTALEDDSIGNLNMWCTHFIDMLFPLRGHV